LLASGSPTGRLPACLDDANVSVTFIEK
jgi:hypothetical protein